MTHSEIVHVYYGLGSMALGLAALWAWRHERGVVRYAWPVLLLLAGASLLLPAETGERRYEVVGWWDTLISVLPRSLTDWLAYTRQVHVLQHKVAGLSIFLAGLAELRRAIGPAPEWVRYVAPGCSMAAGLALGIHGGTHTHLPAVRETVHHWILAIPLVPGGVTWALHHAGRLQESIWRDAWAIGMILVGLEWAVFYRVT
jgi:hypothetical protein